MLGNYQVLLLVLLHQRCHVLLHLLANQGVATLQQQKDPSHFQQEK
jgi:hypothetical protein